MNGHMKYKKRETEEMFQKEERHTTDRRIRFLILPFRLCFKKGIPVVNIPCFIKETNNNDNNKEVTITTTKN